MKLYLLVIIGFAIGAFSVLEAREPTELEQFYLELVNRARANPNGEVTRLSGEDWGDGEMPTATPDLNEGLAPGTITSTAKQPLAFAGTLIDSASDYSDLLLAMEKFGHNENGTSQSRMTTAGYPFGHTYGSGENLGLTTSIGPNPVDEVRADEHHSNLFIDNNVEKRGHRTSIMDEEFREVGIAIRADSDTESFFPPPATGPPFMSDVLSTQNFAYSNNRVFVTGVIYYDTVSTNSFYDVGESAGVLDLEVKNSSNVTVRTGTSFGSGGYSINMSEPPLPSGTYTLIATDSANAMDSTTFFWNNSTNVKADIVDPAFTAPPIIPPPAPTVIPTITHQPDALIGTSLGNLKGNNVYSTNASSQKAVKKVKKTKPVKLFVRFQNDGNFPDRVKISGGKGTKFIKVSYRDLSNGGNATAAFVSGSSLDLGTNSSADYQIQAKPSRRAVGRKAKITFDIRCASVTDPSKEESVQVLVKSKIRK